MRWRKLFTVLALVIASAGPVRHVRAQAPTIGTEVPQGASGGVRDTGFIEFDAGDGPGFGGRHFRGSSGGRRSDPRWSSGNFYAQGSDLDQHSGRESTGSPRRSLRSRRSRR